MADSAKYNVIGTGYDRHRKADPRIVNELVRLLALPAGARVFDLGCGTGNYTTAMAHQGYAMTGLDPSSEMLGKARAKSSSVEWHQGRGENIGLPPASFDGAMTTLTIHHMPDRAKVFAQVRRVLKPGAPFVIFSATPDQTQHYWVGHYWPRAMMTSIWHMPTQETVSLALASAGFSEPEFIPWWTPPDLQDLFWYAGKDRPELYFDPEFRAGISAYREHCSVEELSQGLSQLRADLDSGHWRKIRAAAEYPGGDYCFFVSRAL